MSRPIDYVLPLRWDEDGDLDDLTTYLRWLSTRANVIVVDGSPPALFRRHGQAWRGVATHVAPRDHGFLNGKVSGVHTGLALARSDRVVIADDDVRYDDESLRRTVALLAEADLVGPQNVFDPMPWHALWDTARTLLNRAFAADYPGTFAVRRSTFESMGGYDGNVLFENLELIRTVRAHGGRVVRPREVYVTRRPPTRARFVTQRVRQAYDDMAQPWRLAVFLPVVPLVSSGAAGRRLVALGLVASVAVAEAGRRRGGGAAVFPARAALFAPAWVLERSVCCWVAVGQRVLRGGVRYAGERVRVAAHSPRTLRRRVGPPLVATGRAEADRTVRAVTERFASRPPAAAQGHRLPTAVDLVAVAVDNPEAAAHEQRAVPVEGDQGVVLICGRHVPDRPRSDARETGRDHG